MSHDNPTPSRRALLSGAPAVAAAVLAGGTVTNALAIAEAKAATPDPIYAVIAEYRAAVEASADAIDAEEETDYGTPEREAAAAAIDDGWDRKAATLKAVLMVQPTTMAGVAALLEHVGQEEWLGVWEGDEELEDAVLTTWNNEGGSRKRTAQDFPLRLAATVRSIIERGQS